MDFTTFPLSYEWITEYYPAVILVGIVFYSILNLIQMPRKMPRIYKLLIGMALFVYTVTLLYVTLGMRGIGNMQYELELFWSYREAFRTGEDFLLWENLANVAAFIPLGIFLKDMMGEKLCWYECGMVGLMFSGLIEFVQLVTGRGLFEFDDMMHNTVGTIIGYGVAWMIIKGIGVIHLQREI